jgi:hypothetical protein
VAVAAMLSALGGSGTRADDGALYPNWRGQWTAHHAYDFGPNPSWDPGKPQGLAQEAPLSPPYQALLEASIADQAAGGAGLDRDLFCKPPGMPRMMNVYGTMEILVMPDTTSTAIPLHADNQTVVRERISADAQDGNLIHDEITLIDHALTRPWTVTKDYRRNAQARPLWGESPCTDNNAHTRIGSEDYMLSPDGLLMPTKKGQTPPDLRYFRPRR